MNNIKSIIEGILFVNGDDGISMIDLQESLPEVKPSEILKVILELQEKYSKDSDSAFSIQKFSTNKYRLQTKPELHEYLANVETIKRNSRLSKSVIEVLSIIAYKGPISKSEIDILRTSDSAYQMQKLKEKGLIRVSGKSHDGRANIYEITDNFFKYFNISGGMDSLPKISQDEIEEEAAKINSIDNSEIKSLFDENISEEFE